MKQEKRHSGVRIDKLLEVPLPRHVEGSQPSGAGGILHPSHAVSLESSPSCAVSCSLGWLYRCRRRALSGCAAVSSLPHGCALIPLPHAFVQRGQKRGVEGVLC